MNTFNKKSLCVALAATGLLGAGGVAQAVNLSDDGTGNVLIYPYYTTRTTAAGNAYNTYISFTNTTASTKVVKVRFREGRNSREVLDFNVFLSPFDMWSAAVTPNSDGTGAQVATQDLSCTIPQFTPGVPVAFRNLKYSGANDDGAGTTLDRTMEGYVEVFEMATYSLLAAGVAVPGTVPPVNSAGNVIATNSLHDQATGKPVNCAKVTDGLTGAAGPEALGVQGGLMGTGQLINPGAGASMSYNPTALDNFYPVLVPNGTNFSIYKDTGSPNPAMSDAGLVSAVRSGTKVTVSDWPASRGADAVSAVLMHSAVMNEYILDTGTLSQTNWVVTFPTKNEYVAVGTGAATAPFQSNFDPATGKSCDSIGLSLWDREERNPNFPSGPDFSPKPGGPSGATLCYEANVVTFNGGALLASKNVSVDVSSALSSAAGDKAQNGWAAISFPAATAKLINTGATSILNFVCNPTAGACANPPVLAAPANATYVGLPVVGFNVFSYTNTALKVGSVVANVPTNYGMGVNHKSITTIQ